VRVADDIKKGSKADQEGKSSGLREESLVCPSPTTPADNRPM